MGKFLAVVLAAVLLLGCPAYADIVGPLAQTYTLVAIPASSTKVSLNSQSSNFTIVNTSATATVYFNLVSPVTATNFPILPNGNWTYNGMSTRSFYLISSSGTVNVGVAAH